MPDTLLDERLEGLEGLQAHHEQRLLALLAAADSGDCPAEAALLAIQHNRRDGDDCGWPAVLADWYDTHHTQEHS